MSYNNDRYTGFVRDGAIASLSRNTCSLGEKGQCIEIKEYPSEKNGEE